MSDAVSELFEAVREACDPPVWSRGVEIARQATMLVEHADASEIRYRVQMRGAVASLLVTLWPDDPDWSCECPSQDDACPHVAAAVITLKRAGDSGELAPRPKVPVGTVAYRLRRGDRGLLLERFVARDGKLEPLKVQLQAVATGRAQVPHLVTSQADLSIERALGERPGGPIQRARMAEVLKALVHARDVQLDGQPIRASLRPVVPHVIVEDAAGGFRVRIDRDPAIEEMFGNGAARCGDELRPIGESNLTERERHELMREGGRVFPADQVAALVADVLPALRKRLPVDVRTRRLPDAEAEPPRVVVEVERSEVGLEVLATLVYGDPPQARVDRGQLVLLGDKVPLRDERAEQRLTRRLQDVLGLVPGRRVEVGGEDALAMAARLRTWEAGDAGAAGEVRGRAHEQIYVAAPLEPRVSFGGDEDGLEVEVAFESPAGKADAKAVLRAFRAGASLIPLNDGAWAPLPTAWLREHGERVADLLAAKDEVGKVPTAALPDVAKLARAMGEAPPPRLERLTAALDDFSGIAPAALPADLNAQLRHYQRQGVDWLAFVRGLGCGALLADDMGLGKTLQALTSVRGRTLVVAPTSVLHNWKAEAAKFRPGLKVAVYHGPKRALDPAADLTLTTYPILRLDAEPLAAERWDTVILDEAQAIKNPDSQVAQAAYRLKADFRLAMTGTPVENRLDELWSQMHFTNRGLLGGRADFVERHVQPIAEGKAGAAARLRERIRPFMLRRVKRDVAPELPPRTDVVLRCQLDEGERVVYDAIRQATRREVVERLRGGGSVLAALEALLRLRQAACHSALVPGQSAERSSKVDLLMESIEEAASEGHKALVFSQWTSLLDLVEPHLKAAGLAFSRLDGATRDREGAVQRFQDDPDCPVMLLSLKAGGTGLNLTAADHVFLVDPWWNPAVEDQAADRAHRIGQDRPVFVHRLVAEDTVEERILALQEHKRALADAALAGADRAAAITRDELLALLE